MPLRRRARASRDAAPTASVNSQSSGSHHRSVAGVFKEKMEDDWLELPLLPLKEGELEARLNEMDTTQVKFMIPRIALRSQVSGSVTPAISESGDDGALDSDDLAMVRPNAEVIREIREIKKLQFRCGVAIVLVMIVGVLVLACGIGFIIFHAAKLNRQIETGVQKLDAANELLQNHAKPLLGHVKNTLDEGIGHIDILVNTQMETLMRILNGDDGVQEYPDSQDSAEIGPALLGQRIIGGTKIGVAVTNNPKRNNSDEQATSVAGTTGSCAAGCLGTVGSIGKGICQNILSCGGACDSKKEDT